MPRAFGVIVSGEWLVLVLSEMRVVDQTEELAVRLLHRRYHNIIASFHRCFMNRAAVCHEMIDRCLHVIHAEVRPRAVCHVGIRVEPELVATHVKSDIKRLIKIQLNAEHVRPPGFSRTKPIIVQ